MEGSLEDNILNCLWETRHPLNLFEIWELLDERGIKIPIKKFETILNAMCRLQLLTRYDNRTDYPRYEPHFSLDNFHRNSIRVIQLSLTRE